MKLSGLDSEGLQVMSRQGLEQWACGRLDLHALSEQRVTDAQRSHIFGVESYGSLWCL